VIEPDGVADDVGGEPVAVMGIRSASHRPSYRSRFAVANPVGYRDSAVGKVLFKQLVAVVVIAFVIRTVGILGTLIHREKGLKS
jgi:hypothetical protein